MNGFSLKRLVRHAYDDGTFSYHYAPVEVNTDDALVNSEAVVPASDPADRFTDWPPQPSTVWFGSSS